MFYELPLELKRNPLHLIYQQGDGFNMAFL